MGSPDDVVNDFGYDFSRDDLERIAVETRDEFLSKGKRVTGGNDVEWPNCREVSLAIENRIHDEFRYFNTTVKEVVIDEYYHHHVVKIQPKTHAQSSVIIDASFTQFTVEADTPIDIASINDTSHVVIVSPAESYVFA